MTEQLVQVLSLADGMRFRNMTMIQHKDSIHSTFSRRRLEKPRNVLPTGFQPATCSHYSCHHKYTDHFPLSCQKVTIQISKTFNKRWKSIFFCSSSLLIGAGFTLPSWLIMMYWNNRHVWCVDNPLNVFEMLYYLGHCGIVQDNHRKHYINKFLTCLKNWCFKNWCKTIISFTII